MEYYERKAEAQKWIKKILKEIVEPIEFKVIVAQIEDKFQLGKLFVKGYLQGQEELGHVSREGSRWKGVDESTFKKNVEAETDSILRIDEEIVK